MGPDYDIFIWATCMSWKRVTSSYHERLILCSLALMEIRILTASMVLNYTWRGVPDVPGKWDEEMRPYESMVIRPSNMKCVLELKRK